MDDLLTALFFGTAGAAGATIGCIYQGASWGLVGFYCAVAAGIWLRDQIKSRSKANG